MDLITDVPSDGGQHSILVFVDHLSKMVHLASTRKSVTAEGLAKLFMHNVLRLHGMAAELVTVETRDLQEVSFANYRRSKLLSTAYQPQSDGQTERYYRSLEDMLRHYVGRHQGEWVQHLVMAEVVINNSHHESIKTTPFMLNYGQRPHTPLQLAARTTRWIQCA